MQLMWDLFSSTLQAAEVLKLEPALQVRLREALDNLWTTHLTFRPTGRWSRLLGF